MIQPSIASATGLWLLSMLLHRVLFGGRKGRDGARLSALVSAFVVPAWWLAQADEVNFGVRVALTAVLFFFVSLACLEAVFSERTLWERGGRWLAYVCLGLGLSVFALAEARTFSVLALPLARAALLLGALSLFAWTLLTAPLIDSSLPNALRRQLRPWLLPVGAVVSAIYPVNRWALGTSHEGFITQYHFLVLALAVAVIGELLLALFFHLKLQDWNDGPWYRDCLRAALFLTIGWNYFGLATGRNLGDLLVGSAFLSIGLSFALRPTLGNLASGLILRLARPYSIGDFVEVEGQFGRVQSIDWRSTSLGTLTGDLIVLPNTLMASRVIVNLSYQAMAFSSRTSTTTRQACWADLTLDKSVLPLVARRLLTHALDAHPAVLKKPEPEVYLWNFGAGGIEYRLLYWIDHVAHLVDLESAVLNHLSYHLRRADLEILFPPRILSVSRTSAGSPHEEGLR